MLTGYVMAEKRTNIDEDVILDLSFLTENERALIESVLEKDEKLQTEDRIRLG